MTQDEAIVVVNEVWAETTSFVDAIMKALADGNLSPMEGVQLSMKGLALASDIISILHDVRKEDIGVVKNVLLHGQITVV